MKLPPRSPKEQIVNNQMKMLISLISLVGGFLVFVLYSSTHQVASLEVARSVAFASLGVNTLVYVFSIRTLDRPLWSQSLFSNKWLIVAVSMGFVLQFLPFISTSLGKFLEVTPITLGAWSVIFAVAFMMLGIIEVSKATFLRHFSHHD